jgi:hypothetical protein
LQGEGMSMTPVRMQQFIVAAVCGASLQVALT